MVTVRSYFVCCNKDISTIFGLNAPDDRGIHTVIQIGQLYIPITELMGRMVEARDRDSYYCFYTMKLSFQNCTS
jgi:hypothetical protein